MWLAFGIYVLVQDLSFSPPFGDLRRRRAYAIAERQAKGVIATCFPERKSKLGLNFGKS